uniref:Amino acid permease/ SLC12A domain-containing protein n=1 Tax=Leucosporidium scottii TaxID=5278 RepID=A0A0H5FU55_9BASI|nr:hypothetical protein ls5930a1_00058 [Leucosporidium scottii]
MSEFANKDAERSSSNKEGSDVYVSTSAAPQQQFYDPSKESFWTRAGLNFESYKRAPGTTGGLKVSGDGAHIDPLKEGSNPMLQQSMKPRHLQMIAVGGSIGTGLFIGTGQALRNGGPLGILIAWTLIGIMLINVTQCLGEMCIMYPVSGGFYTLAIRFLDEGFGVSLGYNYLLQWVVVLPLELTAAGITVQYWTDKVPIAGWITVFGETKPFWFVIIFINIFGTLGFAEEEFWSSCLKLFVVVMFIFIGIAPQNLVVSSLTSFFAEQVVNCGGGPDTGDGSYTSYVGGRYWRDPGPLANGFKGICAVFVTAAFSFDYDEIVFYKSRWTDCAPSRPLSAGTELVGLAATETPDPRKTMPTAVKGTFWRITVIYLSSLLIVGLNLPYNDERLLGGNDGTAGTSPFVIMIDKAGIPGLNHLINATICISVLSIGLSCVYAGSRVLTALAETGYAPRVFSYVDKSGRPLWSVLFVLAWGPISYVNVSASGGDVFNWLLALSGLSTLFTWGAICLCHIRCAASVVPPGHSVEELPFRAMGGIWGSVFGCVLVVLVLIAQAVWPIGGTDPDPQKAAEAFFLSYLAMPILLALWLGVYIWKRTLPKALKDIDLDPLPAMSDNKEGSSGKEGSDVHVSTTSAPQQQFYDPSKESFWTRAGLSFESYKRAPGTTGPQSLRKCGQHRSHEGWLKPHASADDEASMLINVTQCLGEMCIMYPVSGGFYTLAIRFLDEGFGVSLGWNYLLQWTVTLPVELTAAGITVQYWTGGVPIAGWITIFWFLIIFINIFGTLGFAEEEFWSSCLKLLVVVNCGGGPDTGDGSYTSYVGGRYWREPGPLANGFKGICAVFVTAAFSFAGTELVGLAATETPDPRKTMPAAVKGTFWRITVIYLSSLLIIGLNLPYNDERLLGGNDGTAGTSPFVIMIDKAGIAGLNHLINVTICISVLSIGLSCVYAGSRVLTALAETGYAPRVFSYVDKSGRPLWSVLFILAWGPDVFNWLLALSGLSTLFTWGSICLCHIRFRMAWKLQGHSVEELPFRAMGGIWGSIFGCVLVVLVLIAQAVWPIGGRSDDPRQAANDFFLAYLAAPILLGIWVVVFIWKRTLPKALKDIDLDTGRKSWLTVEEMREYRAERKRAPWHVKLFRTLFTN